MLNIFTVLLPQMGVFCLSVFFFLSKRHVRPRVNVNHQVFSSTKKKNKKKLLVIQKESCNTTV